jgi:hypothetical protein
MKIEIPDYKKWKSRSTVLALVRSEPRQVRQYNTKLNKNYRILLESFSREDFLKYLDFHHIYGSPGRTRDQLVKHLDEIGLTDSPVRQLAEIRNQDLDLHRRLWQMLKHIWMNLDEYDKDLTNSNSNRFFKTIAIQVTKNSRRHQIEPSWENVDVFAQDLKDLYNSQNGLCALTKEPLELYLGTKTPNLNRLSVDRIDSTKGYIKGNIWLVQWWVNCMKSSLPLHTFKEKVEILHKGLQSLPKSV